MDVDLAYYRHRRAEELTATRSAVNPTVRAAHEQLARLYGERIAALEARVPGADIHLVSAA
jgi:hypothetical protein